MTCEHKDGWVLLDADDLEAINPDLTNDNLEATFECNSIGCVKRKTFKFDIVNVEEIE